MYKNYIFDLYGTLVDINTNEWKVSLWKQMALFYSLSGAPYAAKELNAAYDKYVQEAIEAVPPECYTTRPEPQILYVFKKLYTEKGIECNDELASLTGRFFRMLTIKYIRLYKGVHELFDAIRKHNGRIFLLSNAQRIFTEPEIRMLGLYDEFEDVMISSDEGCAKPDIKFFKKMLEKHNLDPKESIMIGNDHISDIKGAYDAGIDSLYLYTNISPKPEGEILAKYIVMSGSLIEARKLLFGE